MREIDKKRIETAAALHSLLASNADRDGDDIIDMPPPDDEDDGHNGGNSGVPATVSRQ